jgi:hypothetical protein
MRLPNVKQISLMQGVGDPGRVSESSCTVKCAFGTFFYHQPPEFMGFTEHIRIHIWGFPKGRKS